MSEPITREERYLNAIANGETPKLTPITREEMFMAKAAGQVVQVPTPITRKEMFLNKISGGGGTSSGALTEISTVAEMNAILLSATSADVGKAYKYVGETTEAYENNAIYVIKEN